MDKDDRITELEQELEDVLFDSTTTKYRRIRIQALLYDKVNVRADKVQDNARKSSITGLSGEDLKQEEV